MKKKNAFQNLVEYLFGKKYYVVIFDDSVLAAQSTSAVCFTSREMAEAFGKWVLMDCKAFRNYHVHGFRTKNEYSFAHMVPGEFVTHIKNNTKLDADEIA